MRNTDYEDSWLDEFKEMRARKGSNIILINQSNSPTCLLRFVQFGLQQWVMFLCTFT